MSVAQLHRTILESSALVGLYPSHSLFPVIRSIRITAALGIGRFAQLSLSYDAIELLLWLN
jgi:hypothetical protein